MGDVTLGPLIRKVDCVQLPVGDLDAGVAFYERWGHEVIWRRPRQVGLPLPDPHVDELELRDMSKGRLASR